MAMTADTVMVDYNALRLSRHAVERYVERVKPMLEYEQAREELRQLLRFAQFGAERPAWAPTRADCCGWVLLTDGIAFPVVERELVTCLTRGEVGAELRIVREPRGDRARRSRKRRKQHGKVARDERRRARAMRDAADG